MSTAKQRIDLMEIKENIDNGMSYQELLNSQSLPTNPQYRRGIKEYISITRSQMQRPVPKIFIFWGPSGTSKSRRAFEFDPDSTWIYPRKGWFDGYDGQKVAIFDEFDGSDLEFNMWKRICDRYNMTVPIKRGHTPWYPEIIIFTSSFHPDLWWKNERQNMTEDWKIGRDRRITKCVLMDTDYMPGNPWIDIE
jgi:hypothetical protein